MAIDRGDGFELAWRDLVTLPWRRYEIMSHLTPAEITAVMQRVTKPNRWREPQTSQEFGGTVTADGFIVSRKVLSRNSFVPVITGRLGFAPARTPHRIPLI